MQVPKFHGQWRLMRVYGHRRMRLLPCLMIAIVCLPAALLLLTVTQQSFYTSPIHHRTQHYQEEQRNSSVEWAGTDGFRRRMESRMAWRRRFLHDTCSRLGLDLSGNDTLHRPNPWEFLINHNYHLIWCNVFKAASSSWMYNFNVLAGYKPTFLKRSGSAAVGLARRKYPRPTIDQLRAALNDSIAFLIVRHPFERLLSAYRDKIEGALPNTPHQKLGQEIVIKYRFKKTETSKKEKKAGKAKFSYNPRYPTFSEFARYLVDVHRKGDTMDMHWVPITEFCSPCQVDFNIIAKFETLNEDQRYVIDIAGVGKLVKPEWKNPNKGGATNKLINKYFSQLTIYEILQLYNIYRFDFELFDYSLDSYIRVAKLEPSGDPSLS